jgi:hypothetical protein
MSLISILDLKAFSADSFVKASKSTAISPLDSETTLDSDTVFGFPELNKSEFVDFSVEIPRN